MVVVGSRVYRNPPSLPPPSLTGAFVYARSRTCARRCTCTGRRGTRVEIHVHSHRCARILAGDVRAWEYHYPSRVFSVNCHYRRNLVRACVPARRPGKTFKNGHCSRATPVTPPSRATLARLFSCSRYKFRFGPAAFSGRFCNFVVRVRAFEGAAVAFTSTVSFRVFVPFSGFSGFRSASWRDALRRRDV